MKNEKGLTLIELVVSVAVLSILIVPFFGIFTNAAKLDIRSKNEMTADYIAQKIVAEEKNNPFGSDWDSTSESGIIKYESTSLSDYPKFSASIEYESLAMSIESNGKKHELYEETPDIDFNIEWNKDDKSFYYVWEDLVFSESIDDTSNNFDFEIDECNGCIDCTDGYSSLSEYDGPYDYHIAIKVDNNNYWVTIPFNADADSVIGINLLGSDLTTGNKSVTIDNLTNSPELEVRVYTSDNCDHVDIVKQNNNDDSILIDPEPSEWTEASSSYKLTVTVDGYDPITSSTRTMKKIITALDASE